MTVAAGKSRARESMLDAPEKKFYVFCFERRSRLSLSLTHSFSFSSSQLLFLGAHWSVGILSVDCVLDSVLANVTGFSSFRGPDRTVDAALHGFAGSVLRSFTLRLHVPCFVAAHVTVAGRKPLQEYWCTVAPDQKNSRCFA